MFNFMGSESRNKDRQHQQNADGKVQVHVQTEVHSNPSFKEHQDFPTLGSTSSLPTIPSSAKRPLPPGLRVPTHPYPWHHHATASSSQSSLESPVTPSHVSWLAGGTGRSQTTSSSAPNLLPYFPPPPPTAPPANVNASRARPLHPSKSTHSLRLQECLGQPLSPIAEQDYMSPEKRPVSLPNSQEGSGSGSRASYTTGTMVTPITPSMITPTSAVAMNEMVTARTTPTPTTPVAAPQFARRRDDEITGDSPRPSPIYATFLSRPLNRSISISSTRTHNSGNSMQATPPVIPPLDLRPQFPGPLPPDTLISRDIADEGLGHDDESTKHDSFVTAPSAFAVRESRYSAALLDLDHEPIDEEEFPYDELAASSQDVSEYQHDTPRAPPVVRSDLPARPISRTSTSPPSYSLPHLLVDHDDGDHASSLRSLGSVRSTTSSFIDRRFADSEPYLDSRTECSSARQANEKWVRQTEKSDTARTLFWVGFIAPWCWLIGGWLVKAKKSDRWGHTLPLWTGKSTRTVDSFKMRPMQHGYPFVAPSAQDLMPPSFSRKVHPRGPFLMARSPWIRRCRIAACISGVIVMLLFIAALVVVGRSS